MFYLIDSVRTDSRGILHLLNKTYTKKCPITLFYIKKFVGIYNAIEQFVLKNSCPYILSHFVWD